MAKLPRGQRESWVVKITPRAGDARPFIVVPSYADALATAEANVPQYLPCHVELLDSWRTPVEWWDVQPDGRVVNRGRAERFDPVDLTDSVDTD